MKEKVGGEKSTKTLYKQSLAEIPVVLYVPLFRGTRNNLSSVAATVQEMHPDKTIIIAADNDYHLELQGKKNSGLINADKAANEVGGAAIYPPFDIAELSSGKTDWRTIFTKTKVLQKPGLLSALFFRR